MSFWDIVWFIVITYIFVAYLMMLWAIVKDLFRDEQASGFTKALWVIALIVLPILAACIYVISKSGEMTQREMRRPRSIGVTVGRLSPQLMLLRPSVFSCT